MWFALSFVAGCWCLQLLPALPNLAYACLALLPLALLWHGKLAWFKPFWLVLLGGMCGFFWAALQAMLALQSTLPTAWEGQDIRLIGVVASLPRMQEQGERFSFNVERVLTPGAIVPRHISLSDYQRGFSYTREFVPTRSGAESRVGQKPQAAKGGQFHAGERWQLTVRLKQVHGSLNPFGMDFERWALENGLRATGYIRKQAENQRLDAMVWQPSYLVERSRENIRARMQSVLGEARHAGILQALAIGDDAGIAREDWQVLLHTGTNHLMSISGLHITMLSGLVFALVNACWRRLPRLSLWLPARKAAVLAGAVTALCYALIAGFSVPTQRTLYMLLVFACALWMERQPALSLVLAYALLLVVVVDPMAATAPGFWLSFGAVAVMSFALAGRRTPPSWWQGVMRSQWAVTLGLMPLLLMMFQQVSLVSPLANGIAIPVVSWLVVPLTLAGALLPVDWPLGLAYALMGWTMQGLEWLAHSGFSLWQQAAPPAWALPIALLGVVCLLLPAGMPLRWVGGIFLLPMFLLVPEKLPLGAMRVTVLDVGQGLAVVVQTRQHVLLYDTGAAFSSQSDNGNRVILPFLRGNGVFKLDGLVLSHDDADHTGGAASVLAELPTRWLLSSLSPQHALLQGQRAMTCQQGQHWAWDQVQFRVLAPAAEQYAIASLKDNDKSCVLKISSAHGSLLLTGDIEREAESQLLETSAEQLSAEVLTVPHHGSKTSSQPAFVDAVAAKAAIFTVGYRNRFRHPRPDVLARYQAAGANIYRSDCDGAVRFDFVPASPVPPHDSSAPLAEKSASHSSAIEIHRWRQQTRRYWHHQCETES